MSKPAAPRTSRGTFWFRRTHLPTGRIDVLSRHFESFRDFYRALRSWNRNQPETWRYESADAAAEAV